MTDSVTIGIIGDRDSGFPPHPATERGLDHATAGLGIEVAYEWLPTELLAAGTARTISRFDGIWCAPGSPYRSLNGAVKALAIAREEGVPVLGTCGGFQHIVIEYARNVLGFADAGHAEYDPYSSRLFVSELSCSLAGKEMSVRMAPGSAVRRVYGTDTAVERYYCNFGLNPEHQRLFEGSGLHIVGRDADGEARILELDSHPFYVATLFVPQLISELGAPHPLITALVQIVLDRTQARLASV